MKSLVRCAVVCTLFVPAPAVSATPFTLFSTFGPGDSFWMESRRPVGGADAWMVAAEFTPSVTASLASIDLAAAYFTDRGTSSLEISVCR